jgi:hypothetical protein
MATTKADIKRWLKQGKAEGATHVVVVCDTFDWEDYPVYVKPEEDVKEVEKKYSGPNMQRVMEVYNLKKDLAEQLLEHRSFNY